MLPTATLHRIKDAPPRDAKSPIDGQLKVEEDSDDRETDRDKEDDVEQNKLDKFYPWAGLKSSACS